MTRISRYPVLVAILLSYAGFYFPAALSQSWSAWKQLAEEQSKAGNLPEAEASWRAAYQQINSKNSKDSRLYISALALAKILILENKKDEACKLLSNVCTEVNPDCTEAAPCLEFYSELCREQQNNTELARITALLEKHLSAESGKPKEGQTQVNLIFGEAGREDLYKRLGNIRQLVKQKDYTSAEHELEQALKTAEATSGIQMTCLVLREQGKLYCITREYAKAEKAYQSLLKIVKQESGEESQQFIEVLGLHSRILRLLGKTKEASIEEARCTAISEKFKIIPTGTTLTWSSSNTDGKFMQEHNPSALTRTTTATGPARGAADKQQIAFAERNRTPAIAGRLKIIEFYTVW